jgi:sugar lactone lactonase YvrE
MIGQIFSGEFFEHCNVMKSKKGGVGAWLLLGICLGGIQAGAQTPPLSLSVSNQSVLVGGTAVFDVSVSGAGPFEYQWFYDGAPVFVTNMITTVAGRTNLSLSYSGDGGAATNAGLWYPSGVAVDTAGNIYIADKGNKVIRRVDTNDVITTVAGNFNLGGTYSGDGGAATNAGLYLPNDIALDGAGNLFIADTHNNVIRRVDSRGNIATVAGNYFLGGSYSGDGGAATGAALFYPNGIALDGSGNLYVAENGNNVVRRVDPSGIITTVAGDFALGGTYWGDGGAATNAGLWWPNAVAVDAVGNLYIVSGRKLMFFGNSTGNFLGEPAESD